MADRDVVFPAGRQELYERNRYSPAVKANGLLFVSGQVGSREDGSPEPELEAQVRRAFDNLLAILKAAGCTFDDVQDVTAFLVDPEAIFPTVMKVLPDYWGQAPHPTLTAVGVTWLYGFRFEIKVVARLPEGGGMTDAGGADADQTSISGEPQLRFRDDTPVEEPAVTLDSFVAGQTNANAVRLEAGDDARQLLPHLDRLLLIEVSFPTYRDGRGYSAARILREAGYAGELRAAGDVLVDQIAFMRRCGFDSFAPEAELDPAALRRALDRYKHNYQPAADSAVPVWKLRHG